MAMKGASDFILTDPAGLPLHEMTNKRFRECEAGSAANEVGDAHGAVGCYDEPNTVPAAEPAQGSLTAARQLLVAVHGKERGGFGAVKLGEADRQPTLPVVEFDDDDTLTRFLPEADQVGQERRFSTTVWPDNLSGSPDCLEARNQGVQVVSRWELVGDSARSDEACREGIFERHRFGLTWPEP